MQSSPLQPTHFIVVGQKDSHHSQSRFVHSNPSLKVNSSPVVSLQSLQPLAWHSSKASHQYLLALKHVRRALTVVSQTPELL